MLTHLSIRNLATLAEIELDLPSTGLVVLTGETGAGKSLLVESLRFALGARGKGAMVREGAARAEVVAAFQLPADHPIRAALADAELEDPDEPDRLLLRRLVRANGGSVLQINGVTAPIRVLEPMRAMIADLTSQHAHVRLMDPAYHREVLDGTPEVAPAYSAYRQSFESWSYAKRELESLEAARRTREDRLSFLAYLLDEADALDPRPGEEPELEAQWRRLANAEEICATVARLHEALAGDEGSVEGVLAQAMGYLRPFQRLDADGAAPIADRLGALQAELQDIAAELVGFADSVESNGPEREAMEERLEQLRRLRQRLRCEPEDLHARLEELRQERRDLDQLEANSDAAAQAVADAREALESAGQALRSARKKAIKPLLRDVQAVLAELEMPDAELEVALHPREEPGPDGLDDVRLRAQTNPGEGMHPLDRIASGGELSRILLAIKSAVPSTDPVLTTVFDEVDTGLGGSTARALGQLLKRLATTRQVLCVSHLPQVAASADAHIHVRKEVRDKRTFTETESLAGTQRVAVLSRMLGGATTKAAKAHARELLKQGA